MEKVKFPQIIRYAVYDFGQFLMFIYLFIYLMTAIPVIGVILISIDLYNRMKTVISQTNNTEKNQKESFNDI